MAIDVTQYMGSHGHEQVVFATDAPSGLRAIIAVHSTALGPSLGGIRFWSYLREEDAVLDALRLSEAMTMKASMAGLDQGGGKAVVLLDSPDAPHPEPLLRALGQAIHELGGRYLAAEDVGATQHDMDVIALETPWVTGVDPAAGGSGDPSPITAVGVLAAMRAVFDVLDGEPSVAGRKVAVQGAGHVGRHLAADLVPGWTVWSGSCPGGETAADVGARADRVLARLDGVNGTVALFSHGHFLRIFTARWLGLAPADGRLFALDTATICVLAHERENRVIQQWNV